MCIAIDAQQGRSTSADASFDAYVRDRRAALVRYAALLAGSRALAEDLVQDVLVQVYPRWATLGDPHPYVRRSITNAYLSWRRRWSTRHIQLAGDDVLDRPVSPALDDGPDPELWTLLIRLPRAQRAAVVLRYYEGLDDSEIADVLGCRVGTVRAHVSRGLASLRAGLGSGSGAGSGADNSAATSPVSERDHEGGDHEDGDHEDGDHEDGGRRD